MEGHPRRRWLRSKAYPNKGGTVILSDHRLVQSNSRSDPRGRLYYGARYYVPWSGRWLGRDPLSEVDGADVYWFCDNEPISCVDLLGLSTYKFKDEGQNEVAPLTIPDVGLTEGGTETRRHSESNCKCARKGTWKPDFVFIVTTRSEILSAADPLWLQDSGSGTSDPRVRRVFEKTKSVGRRMKAVSVHESAHRRNARGSYGLAVRAPRAEEKKRYPSYQECVEKANLAKARADRDFLENFVRNDENIEKGDY